MTRIEIITDRLVRIAIDGEELHASRHPAIDGGYVWLLDGTGRPMTRDLERAIRRVTNT